MATPDPHTPASGATELATRMIALSDRDMAFVIRISGESLHLLSRHFIGFIETELARAGVAYGDHPLLRLFVETHSRELTDLVLTDVSIRHRFELGVFAELAGDVLPMLRTDLWDSLRTSIEATERHFLSGLGGLSRILAEMEAKPAVPQVQPKPGKGAAGP